MQQQQLQQQLTLLSTMMAVTQAKASNHANDTKAASSRCVSETVDSFVTDAASLTSSSASSVHSLSVFSSFDNLFSVSSHQPHQSPQTVSSPSSLSSSRRHSDEDDDDDDDDEDDEVEEEGEDAEEDDESDTRSVSTTASRFSFKSRRGSTIDVSTSSSSSSTPSTRENKKRLRLARKAELARVSRAKKKQRLDELEQHVNALQNELERLKREERVAVAAATVAARKQRQDKVQQVTTMTTMTSGVEEDAVVGRVLARVDPSLSGQRIEEAVEQLASAVTTSTMSSPEVLSHLIATLNERHQQHLEIGDDLLQRLQQHLKPILPLEFLQWIMSQPSRFYEAADRTNSSNGAASSLWWSLFRDELQCDGAQMKELSALRTTVAKQLKCVNECERAWRRFSEVCRQGVWASEMEQMVHLQSVMEPAQFARFCAWVTRYGHLCLNFQQHINVNSTANNTA